MTTHANLPWVPIPRVQPQGADRHSAAQAPGRPRKKN